jgi:hypothetical protein
LKPTRSESEILQQESVLEDEALEHPPHILGANRIAGEGILKKPRNQSCLASRNNFVQAEEGPGRVID